MDFYQTEKGWLLIFHKFTFSEKNQICEKILEFIDEHGLDGILSFHLEGKEVKGNYYGGPFDTITLLLHKRPWINKNFLKTIHSFFAERARK
jgi:hypothetical protein